LAVIYIFSILTAAAGCGIGNPGTTATPGATASPDSTQSLQTTTTTTAPPTTTTTPPPAPTTAPPTTTTASTTTTTTPPATIPPAGTEFTRLPGDEKRVALTFDGAYSATALDSILATLNREGVPATFFFTGWFALNNHEAVASVVANGFPIGSHSYNHPDFTDLTTEEIQSQLDRTETMLMDAGAPDPRPLFRFPYGARDAASLTAVAQEGYYSIYWTIDTLDWREDRTVQQIRDSVQARLRPGAIILMHVGGPRTAEALPLVISDLRNQGYSFVDIPTALQ
jgi:peptidoglycan/xylan/chitin deacetylase (PgdA/CDA1 family)